MFQVYEGLLMACGAKQIGGATWPPGAPTGGRLWVVNILQGKHGSRYA